MLHHLADILDREGDYWTIVPNAERFVYSTNELIAKKDSVKIITITKYDKHWEQIFEFINLEEITLHEPSKEQVESLIKLTQLKRLRISHLRINDLNFIVKLQNLEELILEYVSGFSDLSPLINLKKIKSLHFENLRKVTSFDGLRGLNTLKYLHIGGTIDWNQPIENFIFFEGIPNLEVFSLGFIINKTDFPAFLPILTLKKLKRIKIGRSTFKTKEYAFLESALPKVEGSFWELYREFYDNFVFLGKSAGSVRVKALNAKQKCDDFKKMFDQMKKESETLIKFNLK